MPRTGAFGIRAAGSRFAQPCCFARLNVNLPYAITAFFKSPPASLSSGVTCSYREPFQSASGMAIPSHATRLGRIPPWDPRQSGIVIPQENAVVGCNYPDRACSFRRERSQQFFWLYPDFPTA